MPHFLCACARLVVCACACRSVFIIDHGRVEATEKEADERRKRREDVRRRSKGESGARRRDECTRHGEGFSPKRKDPRRCCCENAGEEEDGDETVSDGGRDDELCSGRYDDDDDDSRRRSAFYRGGDFRGRGSRRLDAFDRFARIEGTSAVVVGVVVVFVAEVVLQIGVGRLGGCLGRSWR